MSDVQSNSRGDIEHVQRPNSTGLSCFVIHAHHSDASVVSSQQDRNLGSSDPSQPDHAEDYTVTNGRRVSPNASQSRFDSYMELSYRIGSPTLSEEDAAPPPRSDSAMLPPPAAPWQSDPPPPPWQVNTPPPSRLEHDRTIRPARAHRSGNVDGMEQEQDDLRDARNEVLGARFRLQASRRQLGNLRQESGAQDGLVFSMMSRLLLEKRIDAPHALQQARDEASKLRDQLGLLETEYEEAEHVYNTMEWKYTRKESKFIEKLLDNNPRSSASSENNKEDRETAELTSFAGEHQEYSDPLDATALRGLENCSVVHNTYERMESTLAPHQEPLLPRRASSAPSTLNAAPITARPVSSAPVCSDMLSISPVSLHCYQTATAQAPDHTPPTKAHREDDDRHPQVLLFQRLRRIDEWLLDIVDNSRLQKAQFKALHCLDFLADDTWWVHMKESWNSDDKATAMLHTGDSTVASDGVEDAIRSSASETSESSRSAFRVSDTTRTVTREQPLELFSQSEEDAEFDDNKVQQSGLYDVPSFFPEKDPRHATNLSVSSGLTPSRRTSASVESYNTDTSLESQCERQGCAPSAAPRDAGPIERTPMHVHTSTGTVVEDDLIVQMSPMEQYGHDPILTMPRRLTNSTQLGTGYHFDHIDNGTVEPLQDHLPRSDHTDKSDHPVTTGPIDASSLPSLLLIPPSPDAKPLSTIPVTQPRGSRCPFFRALEKESWLLFPFPFLQLTSPAINSSVEGDQRMESQFLPFVSLNDHLPELPGPVPGDLY